MKITSAAVIVIAFVTSCKKEKLEGDKSILIGDWEWIFTKDIVDYCDPDFSYTQILTPVTELTSFQLKFLEKGKVQFFQNNQLLETNRIVFEAFYPEDASDLDSTYTYFSIALDNENSDLQGYFNDDTMIVIRDFPHPEGYCDITTSYFVRK